MGHVLGNKKWACVFAPSAFCWGLLLDVMWGEVARMKDVSSNNDNTMMCLVGQ